MADFSMPIAPGGAMSIQGMGSASSAHGALDEPVMDTIMRDVRMVGNKMMCVLNP